MKPLKLFAVGAVALFVSTSAMALRPTQTDTRSRPAGSVIDVILNRDGSVDKDRRKATAKEQDKRDRKRAKELRKQDREREKDLREAARERAKDERERRRDRNDD